MTSQTYRRITNTCLWVALASAICYDWLGHSAMYIGILAGVISITTYFVRHLQVD